MAARESRMKTQAQREGRHLAEEYVRAAVDEIGDRDGPFVLRERDALAHPVRNCAADEQADAGESPDDSDAQRPGVEDFFAKEAEQDLGRAASAGPPDAQHRDAEDERCRAHVGDAFAILRQATLPVLSPGFSSDGHGLESAWASQLRDADRGDDERESVEAERNFEPILRADRAEKCADGQAGPGRGLGHRVRGVEFVRSRDARENRVAARGEERRREHQSGAQQVEEQRALLVNAENEAERDYGAREVACDHDPLPVEAVEQHARDGAGGRAWARRARERRR